ncbi:Carbonic anhydrase 1 [Bremerella volcania]|uniref:carbonic anhydrase n=1 Tax=Bremerella volcania TaxID=2527984 RepID=A0A518C3B2_9BACT|nr:carbonic anhydrase [Bremerella volcania]QDU73709.1 Carbonic anhydrase 1 [Bremerella volcania]
MNKLDSSLHRFPVKHFGTASDFLLSAESEERDTLMIACADQGGAPDRVSFAKSGRFFVVQHLASSIRPAGDRDENSEISDIEFAFSKYKIKHVIICGHTGCGVIRNWLLYPDAPDVSGIRARFEQTTLEAVNQAYPEYSAEDRIEALICEHTLFQLEHLCSHAFIRNKLEAGTLQLHAWVVNDNTARVRSYDPARGCFAII